MPDLAAIISGMVTGAVADRDFLNGWKAADISSFLVWKCTTVTVTLKLTM